MQKSPLSAIPFVTLLVLGACSTFQNPPLINTVHHIVPRIADAERTEFAPSYRYLRVVIGDRVVFMASDSAVAHSSDATSVWYSAGREVLRFQDGRLVAAVGMAAEWRSAVLPELPSWSELARAKEPIRWGRIRDVMPGYHYGVRDELLLQRITPPNDSQLKNVDPNALTWFEEQVSLQRAGVATELVLPRTRYAVDLRDANGTVVYGEQCISAELCFSWQQWPAVAENKK